MLEVNEYVRTDKGKITKIIGIDKFIDGTTFYETEDNPGYMDLCNENIVKHSKQLIDLIEVGDIVNGMEVLDIHKPRDLWEPIEIRVDSRYTNFILAEDIKTILTKEQMMANCYKVGGKDEF